MSYIRITYRTRSDTAPHWTKNTCEVIPIGSLQ